MIGEWSNGRHDAAKARCAAATGPLWKRSGDGIVSQVPPTRGMFPIPQSDEDLDFIACARQDLPAAILEIERLRAENQKLIDVLNIPPAAAAEIIWDGGSQPACWGDLTAKEQRDFEKELARPILLELRRRAGLTGTGSKQEKPCKTPTQAG